MPDEGCSVKARIGSQGRFYYAQAHDQGELHLQAMGLPLDDAWGPTAWALRQQGLSPGTLGSTQGGRTEAARRPAESALISPLERDPPSMPLQRFTSLLSLREAFSVDSPCRSLIILSSRSAP
jgi:hypothetical protein